MLRYMADNFLEPHPLIQWYAAVPDIRPQSMARVPPEVSPKGNQALITELMQPIGAEHALSLPVAMDRLEYRAFVVCRGDDDFTDDDLELAAHIQRLLIGLDRQIEINSSHHLMTTPSAVQDTGLTGREQAVLALLADGYTAVRIAHTLGVSQRTVHKHLENLYRKLQVPDRLSAVLQAQALGLIEPATNGAGR
jgi:DNA-binding NarL/FixJ family response regulator